jgi:L-threonylcarbamoyladenylate synthase
LITEQLFGNNPADIARAARLLCAGELVAVPTETVYGLAANAMAPAAVTKIFQAKGRPQDNPLIVHVLSLKDAEAFVEDIPAKASRLAQAYWPGPLTIVLKKTAAVPNAVTAGLCTVALRAPAHPVARALLQACGLPLAAPSANRSGFPSPTTARHVLDDMAGRIAAVLEGGSCGVGVESTVVSLAGPVPVLLRPGGISPAQLEATLGELHLAEAITKPLAAGQQAQSPGMKYQHYAPKAALTLVNGTLEEVVACAKARQADGLLCFDEDKIQLTKSREPFTAVAYGPQGDCAAQARQLFARLRELDDRGLQNVLVRCPSQEGVGLAVYNRLLRAAGFRQFTIEN